MLDITDARRRYGNHTRCATTSGEPRGVHLPRRRRARAHRRGDAPRQGRGGDGTGRTTRSCSAQPRGGRPRKGSEEQAMKRTRNRIRTAGHAIAIATAMASASALGAGAEPKVLKCNGETITLHRAADGSIEGTFGSLKLHISVRKARGTMQPATYVVGLVDEAWGRGTLTETVRAYGFDAHRFAELRTGQDLPFAQSDMVVHSSVASVIVATRHSCRFLVVIALAPSERGASCCRSMIVPECPFASRRPCSARRRLMARLRWA